MGALSSLFQTKSVNPGGTSTAKNLTAIGQIKNGGGNLRKLHVITAASAGNLVLNDMATGGTPAAANQVQNIPNSALTQGAVITLDIPFTNGIAITGTWPTGLVLMASYD